MTVDAIYHVTTHNDAVQSENRIHSDEIAQQFGFEGALVAGVVVFGHMTYLPIKAEGTNWLTDNRAEVRFLKPAYDGQELEINNHLMGNGFKTECFSPTGTLLSVMESAREVAEPQGLAQLPPATETPEREEITWDRLFTDKPAPAYTWHADRDTHLALCDQLKDDNTIYQEGSEPVVHPFWIARQCNAAFARSFILPAWIHVGTRFHFHEPLRAGHDIEVRMIPTEKWEKKGHQFVTLYIPFLVNGEVCVECEHTAIFRIAPPD